MVEPNRESPPEVLLSLYRLLSRIHAQTDLADRLQAIVDAVVEAVGFEVAALNVARESGDFEVVAVAGSADARREMLGVVLAPAVFEAEFAAADHWGKLRFIPHERSGEPYRGSWVPDREPSEIQGSWHPEDALLAPKHEPDGALIGVLSVDLPRDGMLPSSSQLGLLEVLADEVAIAVHQGLISQRIRMDEEIFRRAFVASGTGITLSDVENGLPGPFIRVNPAMVSLLGWSPIELSTHTEDGLTHPDDRSADQNGMEALMSGRAESFRRDKRLRRADGGWQWVTATTTITRSENRSPNTTVSQFDDVSARRVEWERLQFDATHDALTHLPLRPRVLDRLRSSTELARRTGRPGVVMFLDVNDFKAINDGHGHAVGDHVLQLLARRIRDTLRPVDLVGRVGGDEFVAIADGLSAAEAWDLAEEVGRVVAKPIDTKGVTFRVSMCIGLCPVDGDTTEPAELLRQADLAMYQQKRGRVTDGTNPSRRATAERGLSVGWSGGPEEQTDDRPETSA